MNRFLIVVLVAILVTLTISVSLALRPNLDLTINCRNELHDTHGESEIEYYLVVDVVFKGSKVSMNFRYFNEEGEPHSRFAVSGSLTRSALFEEVYELTFDTIDLQALEEGVPDIRHMHYISGFFQNNLLHLGEHKTTMRVLERNEQQGYALFFMQPSNSVVACSVIE